MMSTAPFNYLITIHNKEKLLPEVLAGVERCAGSDAIIVAVLDGCTDGSELIVRAFAARSRTKVRLVTAPDVHEIRAINSGLRHCEPGFCIVLQDDVVLGDPTIETQLRVLHASYQGKLGLVSLRMGGAIGVESWLRRLKYSVRRRTRVPPRTLDIIGLIGSPYDTHPVPKVRVLAPNEFQPLAAVYKSPICITPELRSTEPFLDENLAPYGYDDLDLSIRALRQGLLNGVLACAYTSDVEWGGTRLSPDFASASGRIVARNRAYLWRKHRDFLSADGNAWLRTY